MPSGAKKRNAMRSFFRYIIIYKGGVLIQLCTDSGRDVMTPESYFCIARASDGVIPSPRFETSAFLRAASERGYLSRLPMY